MLATAITSLAAGYLFAGLFKLASHKPGYSHRAHLISEIGESGAPKQRLVSVGLFLPVGLLMFVVACLVRSLLPPAAALALCIAAGYLGAAAFPCDPGSPLSGSRRQFLHNLAGAIEYFGGGFSLIALAQYFGQLFAVAGVVVLGAAIGLSVIPSTSARGAVQRIAELCLFGGLILAVWRIESAA